MAGQQSHSGDRWDESGWSQGAVSGRKGWVKGECLLIKYFFHGRLLEVQVDVGGLGFDPCDRRDHPHFDCNRKRLVETIQSMLFGWFWMFVVLLFLNAVLPPLLFLIIVFFFLTLLQPLNQTITISSHINSFFVCSYVRLVGGDDRIRMGVSNL